jgi:hypothetical protein
MSRMADWYEPAGAGMVLVEMFRCFLPADFLG